ncbi:hypothetical protein ACF05X_18955 [Streptomyces werraensis]|uniref:hypothetical protein n=1 Tax=Streptomyces werraensis TaxID=68284 RepID=UPI0036FF1F0D
MFEIRAICDPGDADRVTAALSAAFTTGSVRRHPSRDGMRVRLYVTADHRRDAAAWPAPDDAYSDAPSIGDEIAWTTATSAHTPIGQGLDREYFLRKAALLDRMALTESDHPDDVAVAALDAARILMTLDDTAAICDPRAYVRQQYAHWAQHH